MEEETKRPPLIILLLSLLFVSVPDNYATPADSTVQFRLARNEVIVIPVMVNGKGPFDFMLDTGTTTTVISSELAEELSLTPVDRSLVRTVTGSRTVPRAVLQSLALGPKEEEGLIVLFYDIPGIRSLDKRIRGVLGYDFLSRFNYLLDYGKKRIALEERRDLEPHLIGTRIQFAPGRGRLLVPVRGWTDDPETTWLVLDTAAARLMLFESPTRRTKLDIRRNARQPAAVSSSMGRHFMRTGWVGRLTVGDETFRDVPVVLVTRAEGVDGRSEDGLLPARLFESLYFNHRDNFLVLNPRFQK